MRSIKKGSTDQSVVIRIVNATTGLPETAVEHNTSGIDLWYRREGAVKTSITEAALTALNDAHSDGGIEHIGDGYYRLDPPDAAFDTGANGVAFGGTVTGMVVIGCYVHLVDYDPQNAVRLGLTALPNAAADGAGGLPISDAGGLDLDARIGASFYVANVLLTVDAANTKDEYTVTWFKDRAALTSGVTDPTIQVVKRVDGTDLVASTAMTEIGTTESFKYDEATNRVTAGEAALVVVTATIDGSTRSWSEIVTRDSAA